MFLTPFTPVFRADLLRWDHLRQMIIQLVNVHKPLVCCSQSVNQELKANHGQP